MDAQLSVDAGAPSAVRLLLVTASGIALLLYLIIRRKLQAFVALLFVSILIGLGAGMGVQSVLSSVQFGMGDTLKFVAIVVGLGAMFGQMLEVSGGAESLARQLLKVFGDSRAPWALGITGFIISIPAFFDVGFVILVPLLYGLARRSGKALMFFAMPLMGGMVVTHAFIPPTPGPIGVAGLLNADLGLVILFGLVAGVPAMVLAGPVWASVVYEHVPARIPDYMEVGEDRHAGRRLPGVGKVAGLILLPLVLILLNAVTRVVWDAGTGWTWLRETILLVGDPIVALLLTAMLCFRLLGTNEGFSREQVQNIATRAMEPAGIIILVTGAGGVLKQVLIDSQVGELIAQGLAAAAIPLVLVAFLIAATVRVMQGSATVAMLTAAGLVAPLLEPLSVSEVMRALLVIPIASGATFLSHVNDSGFWLVNRYLGMSVPETLKSWSVMTMIVGLTGLVASLILSSLIHLWA